MNNKALFSILVISLIHPASAQLDPSVISDPIRTIACTFATALVYIAAAIAALVFVLAGVKWIYAQDDAGKRKAARDTMIHCIIGLVIILMANQVILDLLSDTTGNLGCGTGATWTGGW
ncbi:MAG: pilin [Methanobacteriota archaeon]